MATDTPDLTSTRVLIPRTRRVLEGPVPVSGGLSDEQINGLIADAVANVILFTGGLFGHELAVADRDTDYGAPTAWQVTPALTEAEGSVIVAQASLDYFLHRLETIKTQERIADEGAEWQYQISAQGIAAKLKMLQDQRDRALEQIRTTEGRVLDAYVSFIAERDYRTSALIEPWVEGGRRAGLETGDVRGFLGA